MDKDLRAGVIRALTDECNLLKSEVARLTDLVYVPGLWRCAKCGFQLHQMNLNARDGTVSARDEPGDRCPNCSVSLWRVTEREAGNQMCDRLDDALKRVAELEAGKHRCEHGMFCPHYDGTELRDPVDVAVEYLTKAGFDMDWSAIAALRQAISKPLTPDDLRAAMLNQPCPDQSPNEATGGQGFDTVTVAPGEQRFDIGPITSVYLGRKP